MTVEDLSNTQESNSDEQKNACILKIIEALKEHKINELKKLATEMKMNFDDELYTQIENLKDSEIDELTKYLLKWLRNPEIRVHPSPNVLKVFNELTKDNFAKYKKFVKGLLSPAKDIFHEKINLKNLKHFVATKEMRFDKNLYECIEKLTKPEIANLINYLGKWLDNQEIDMSGTSPQFSYTFLTLIGDKGRKYRNFVGELFRKGILDKRHVIDVLNSWKNNKYKVMEPSDDIAKIYGDIGLYHCKSVAYNEPGQFQGILFRLKDKIYQIRVDDVNDRTKLFQYFMSLGFKN